MKKYFFLVLLSLSFFLLSCSQMRTQMKKKPSNDMAQLMETVETEDTQVGNKPPEYTHEIAEANADDSAIKKEVGESEIDEELPGSTPDKIPYAKNFLANKKTNRMQFWVDYFTKKERERFQRFINNGEEYRHHIEAIFEQHGLPKELYFVGLIESGYYLGARSHASAVGPWQFIKGTGKRYGLKMSSEFDERQDLFKATRSAALYFRDLHNVFSSWELALSAYNAGENGIIRRIMKHGTRDFYQLSKNKQLPSETINYVPKVLAAMHVVNNAEKYGFHIPKKKYRFFDRTELQASQKNVSLKKIAQRLGISFHLLKRLNPELRRDSTPRYFAGTYYLRVPKSRYSPDTQELTLIKEPLPFITRPESRRDLNRRTAAVEINAPVKPRLHQVRRGETLTSIAHKYGLSPIKLASLNQFKKWNTKVRVGQKLNLVASSSRQVESISLYQGNAPKVRVTNSPIVYKVRRGDNLTDLARIFQLNVSKIKTANKLRRGKILVGQKIVLPDTQKAIYTVKRGDHLNQLAREFNFPMEAMVKLNSLKQKTIYPGQKIIVNMD